MLMYIDDQIYRNKHIMMELSRRTIHDDQMDNVIETMREIPRLHHMVNYMLDSIEAPVDPKTGLTWAKPFFGSTRFRNWLRFDQRYLMEGQELPSSHGIIVPAHEDYDDEDSSLAALFIDGDGWKKINYEHGHDGGDEAIQSLGRHVRGMFRAEDHVLRMGGDEFIVLAKNVPNDELPNLADSVQDRLGSINLRIAGADYAGSATAGMSTCLMELVRPQSGYDTARQTIVRADAALVTAKRAKYRKTDV